MSAVKMKYADVAGLARRGALSLDTSALEVEDGYKVFRTLRSLRDAAKSYDEQKAEIVKSRVSDEELRRAQEYEKAGGRETDGLMSRSDYEAVIAKLAEANRLVARLEEDEVEVESRPVPFKVYHALKKANGGVLKSDVDIALEGVLWQDEEERKDEPAGTE